MLKIVLSFLAEKIILLKMKLIVDESKAISIDHPIFAFAFVFVFVCVEYKLNTF